MLAVSALALAVAALPPGRTLAGVHAGWAAFSDASPRRCFAIAQPVRGGRGGFLSVSWWPATGRRPQVQVHLSRRVAGDAPVTLTVGERRFTLLAGGADAWAQGTDDDLRIVSAMRLAPSLSVEAKSERGAFADGYALAGAPTAIDAAALACRTR